MGVNGLFKDFLKGFKLSHTVKLSHVKEKRLGIDTSAWIYPPCKHETVAMCMQAIPAYPPTQLIEEFKRCVGILRQVNIPPVFVFEGHRHPMKYVARMARDTIVDRATKALDRLYEKARTGEKLSDTERDQFKKNWTAANIPTGSLIATIAELFEEMEIEYRSRLSGSSSTSRRLVRSME
jgi:hypothetical protein